MTAERVADELQRLGVSGVRVIPVRELNGVFIRGPLAAVRSTLHLLESIDLEAPTVFVELLVVEYSHGKRFEWRFDVTNATYGRISDGSSKPPGVISGTYNFVTQIKKPFKFNLVALVTDDLARVVTNPHVAVQNGNPATIRFDHEEHIVLIPPPASNAVTTSKIEVVTAPIELTITPIATGDGTILLDVSGIVAFFVGETNDRFSIDKHTVKSKVAVREGETLILGGLIKENRWNSEAGIPYIRHLPLIGHLFKDRLNDQTYSEVVIYITPRLSSEQPFDERAEEETIDHQLRELEKRQRKRGRRW